MPAIKLFNVLALSTLAILLSSFAPSQTLALSLQSNHLARQLPNHHGISKKRKRGTQCKPRSSSTPAPVPTSTPLQDYTSLSSNSPQNDPSPSSTQSPNPVATNASNGSGKLAIAWALGDDSRVQILLAAPRVKMFHLWDANIPSALKASNMRTSIMLWGIDQQRISDFVAAAKPGYTDYVFGFNEPNEPTQSNMSPEDGVSAWQSYIRPLADQGYTLGSPATTSAPDGFDWMTNFMQQCNDCAVTDIALHWYDVHFSDFQTYVEKWATAFKKPVRITEFACQNFNGGDQPSMDDIWSFTTQAIPYLEGSADCVTYAPFGFMDDLANVNPEDGLFTSTGLSSLGSLYVYYNGTGN